MRLLLLLVTLLTLGCQPNYEELSVPYGRASNTLSFIKDIDSTRIDAVYFDSTYQVYHCNVTCEENGGLHEYVFSTEKYDSHIPRVGSYWHLSMGHDGSIILDRPDFSKEHASNSN